MRDFEAIVGRIVGDPQFRKELFRNVRGTAEKYRYSLGEKELVLLENLDRREIESVLADLDTRIAASVASTVMCTTAAEARKRTPL